MRRHSGTVSALVLALAACGGAPHTDRTVQRYLLCEECSEGELDSVFALGERGEKALIVALDGPPSDRVENMRLQAASLFKRIKNPTTTMTQQEYVDHYVANYSARYVTQAGLGLRRFNTPSAHKALIEAVRRDSVYRPDVRRALGAAAGVQVVLVQGDQQDAAVGSFVKVNPTVWVTDSMTGEGLKKVRVEFLVDSGGGNIPDSIRFTGSDGRAAVRWRLGPDVAESLNTARVIAAGHTLRLRALAHDSGARVVFLVQPSNGIKGQPITPPIRFVVQDAFGTLLTNFNTSAQVSVVPLALASIQTVTNGLGDLTGYSVPVHGAGLRLKVGVLGAQTAYSQPFDIAP